MAAYNVDAAFLDRITADHYVISGNGGHGNPHPDTLRMLFEARGDSGYQIHLTYSPEAISAHTTYINKGRDAQLAQLLAENPSHARVISYPDEVDSWVEINLG